MSNLIEIKKGGIVYLEGQPLAVPANVDANDLFLTLSGIYTKIENGLTLGELVSAFYRCTKLLDNLFSEDFEALRVLINTPLPAENKIKQLVFKKSLTVEEEEDGQFIYPLVNVDFQVDDSIEKPYNSLSSLPVIVSDELEVEFNVSELSYKTRFTLLDIMTCVFEETSDLIKFGNILTQGLVDEQD